MNVKCPTCGAPVTWESCATRPFCSHRCKLIDLGRWLDEEYGIPAENEENTEPDEQSN